MLLHYMVEKLQSSKCCYSVKVSRFMVDIHVNVFRKLVNENMKNTMTPDVNYCVRLKENNQVCVKAM